MKNISILVALFLTGCTLTVAPDGSRTWTMSGEEVGKAIIIISSK